MRICLDGRMIRPETGGIGRYTRQLLKEILKLDQTNQYFLLTTPLDREEAQKFKAKNLKIIEIDALHFTLAEQTKLWLFLNKFRFDLVHFTNFNHPIFYHRPFLMTIHDLTMIKFPVGKKQQSMLYSLAFRQVLKDGLSRSKMIIVDSLVTKNDLIQFYHLSPERIRVIYLGVDDSFRSLSSMEISQFLTENKLTQPYLLYIGQWRPHKGIIEAVKAFELVKKKLPQLKLVIGGKPNPDFPDITQIIEDSSVKKDIILPGFIADKDLVDYYNGAMAFLFPSFYEGFGLPPLEAMACGTPVIASNRSCLPEILGQAADLIDPKKTNQFAQAIINMVNDQARQEHFRQLGFRQAKQYSWKKMAEETLAVYRSIFATKGK